MWGGTFKDELVKKAYFITTAFFQRANDISHKS